MWRTVFSRSPALLYLAAALGLANAFASVPARADDDGWREDFGSLTHYSGLSCPERIGALERFEVTGTTSTMLASCTYRLGEMSIVVQLWEQGYLKRALENYRARFATIGFKRVAGSSMAARGLTFVVGHDGQTQRRETIWPVTIGRRGMIVWMNYAYPIDEGRMETAYTDMVEMLRAMK
ncbi:hypothetical protein C8N35_102509 [Breoghania corrubedonensis]|uniref:Uncharacterized protein n=1 Tax=Breoghania corrubedonensis TaxID=665038 RepID=A0A2T5VDI5_9HYPH|nr:hypothetical protein [Breoghania corrubedonensis]PTW61793.1 hypothetical protein C8N35_102509 [Breoghania corrubedonensis]